MRSPNTLFTLSKVQYNEPNREIVCSFANNSRVKSQRYAFFPVLLTTVSSEQLVSFLSASELRQLQFAETKKGTLKIIGADFSVLQELEKKIRERFPALTLLLSPERQFLLQQGWGFFDAFLFEKQPEKVSGLVLPETSLGFLPSAFPQSLSELLEAGARESAEQLCRSLAYSNALCVPLQFLPSTEKERVVLLLENQFFLAGILENDTEPFLSSAPSISLPLRVFENTAEFDFSNATALLCTKNHYNLGLETMDCDCCRPSDAAAENLLPFSLVKTRILSNGFFFESFFSRFARKFHESNPEKERRLERQHESGLPVPPLGPFFAGQLVEIPKADAEQLEKDSDALIVGLGKQARWFCMQKESVLSTTLDEWSEQIVLFQKRNMDLERKALARDRLQGLALLERNPHYFFQKIVLRVFESLFGQLPVFLQQKNAFVFSAKLAVGIAEARELALRRFVAFSQSNGYRVLSDSHGNRAFVQKTSGFGLVRDFSVSGNHPLPEIVEWHFSVPEKSMAAKKPVFGSFSD
jgi:hypothetical protein